MHLKWLIVQVQPSRLHIPERITFTAIRHIKRVLRASAEVLVAVHYISTASRRRTKRKENNYVDVWMKILNTRKRPTSFQRTCIAGHIVARRKSSLRLRSHPTDGFALSELWLRSSPETRLTPMTSALRAARVSKRSTPRFCRRVDWSMRLYDTETCILACSPQTRWFSPVGMELGDAITIGGGTEG